MFIRDLLRFEVGADEPARRPVLPRPPNRWPLDHALVSLSPSDALTIGDCVCGVQVFGASGSGKTSGSVALLARAMLVDGWGLLVLTTKPGEADQWQAWAERAGRGSDVVRITPGGPHCFNFLDYLDRHPDRGAAVASNIADVMMTLASHAKPKKSGNETSEFFTESASHLVTQAIHLLRAAGAPLTLSAINDTIGSAPLTIEEVSTPLFESGYLAGLLRSAEERALASPDPDRAMRAVRLHELCDYWLRRFPTMSDRTRGDVIATLSSVIFRFTEPPFDQLIASEDASTFIPEMIDLGRVMILDCPVVTYQLAGRLFQIAVKHLTQQMVLRRRCADSTRPVAIFADEAQNFATHADYRYQAICRDFRGCTVYATQTIDNYQEAVGSEHAVEALLASLVTKVFHANAGRTNEWAEKLIAQDWGRTGSDSFNHRGGGGGGAGGNQNGPSFGSTESDHLHPQVLAAEFTRLRTGGSRNHGQVEAIVFQPGRRFTQTRKPILSVTFAQGM
ncbi:MAG: type IV secretory system conjugative DNA transfer family protein [Phycisphaerales bacterium]